MRKDFQKLTDLLIELYDKMASWDASVVRGSGLSAPQIHTIEVLGNHPRLRMKELAEKIGVTTGTMTVMIDRLEAKGLVERKPHPDDRRSYVVDLTEKGQKSFKEHHDLHIKLTEDIASPLTNEEIAALINGLEKILEGF
ncbi:Transcriptional regulator, MarR family [Dissulfuribacter thermophilus]|uniref:Transcriptional regulator, MarR family n=1 Tax=Dissulfuribacter thermophilus TaxID=1156395 RepID=A0A1B9F6V2_9BACT|nr:MarR family transcriptional regulator [Dissulfuribacter thermophilus]OCC15564.1 Transcriptional regulator, MarR family [Dissulfuribacter thermophilus]